MQIGLLEPDSFSAQAIATLQRLGPVRAYRGEPLADFLADAQAVFVRLARRIDAGILSLAPRLRFLCSPTTGHNHLDLDALAARGVRLLSLRGETAFLETIRATPEHALGLVLASLRNYRAAFMGGANTAWDRDRHRGEEIYGLAVGIVGMGRVGRRLAAYLQAMEARVGWCDPAPRAPVPAYPRFATPAELIAASRVVVLAASHTPGQAPILGPAEVDLLAGRYLVNVARGELVDEEALLAALESGRLAGCATDVLADETGANRLARWLRIASRDPRVVLTPHIAGATWRSMRATEEFLADRLAAIVTEEDG